MSSPRSSSLIRAESGPLAGQSFALDRSPFCVGRGADNDLVVPDTSVSRKHACFELQGNQWLVRDLGSSNGTFLNHQAVKDSPQPLGSGDLVAVGDSVFQFTTQSLQVRQVLGPAPQPAANRQETPGPAQRRPGWIVAAVIAVVLVAVIVAGVLLLSGLVGQEKEAGSTPGLPSIPGLGTGTLELPTGFPSAFPTMQFPTDLPTGFPSDLPLPTGEFSLPTGLPDIPLP